eukprot:NODE_78_length_23230_cov_1.644979.p6 type:complete len:340 gc:universal NODE_78_length_23230_cov_1.644979:1372-2391(+)
MTKQKQQKQQKAKKVAPKVASQLPFFSHLEAPILPLVDKSINPIIQRIGILMAKYQIIGSNARTIAILNGILEWINTAEKSQLTSSLNHQINFINSCRPLGVSVGNTVRFIKNVVTKHAKLHSKSEIIESITNYKENRIYKSMDHISMQMQPYFKEEDLFLVYGKSSTVLKVLNYNKNKRFKVLIVNSEPLNEGQIMKKHLDDCGIINEIIDVSSISSIITMVSKVLLGAHAMLSNGSLISRIGTGIVASTAKLYNIPVIVCCETHKFSDRIYMDGTSWNELGTEPVNLDKKSFLMVNPMYDIVPAHFLSMICCDIGCIPPTSIPVALREDRQMMNQYE